MKTFITALLLTCTLLMFQEPLKAQDRGFGIGATIGTYDGISWKNWISDRAAVAGLITFSIAENTTMLHAHADYLMHKFYESLEWEVGHLHYYYGGGLGLTWREWSDDNIFTIRAPSGLGFNFTDVPIDLFFELAPTLAVAPSFQFGFEGSIGFRFYLN
ncbi:MAG: hypothetical protein WDZ29_03690 [Balneolaceae bacterium]